MTDALPYRAMGKLLACPFCRELTPSGEATHCRDCGVALVPMEKLPPSLDALHEEAARGEYTPPEYKTLPWTYWGRGRGALMALAALGLVAFFAPWVVITSPSDATLSGFALAHTRAGWLWGGAVAWFLLLPLVFTRRSIIQLRGIRVVAATFALMTLGETCMMLLLAPSQSPYVHTDYHFAWGLYSSALVSALATYVAARLGGSLNDLRDLADALPVAETSDGQPVH